MILGLIMREMEKINIDTMFLGPKSENQDFFMEALSYLMEDHIQWRRDFHPHDNEFITPERKNTKSFVDTQNNIKDVLVKLSEKLKESSVPWFSPRYLGHMVTDLLMPATLGYMAGILYNPNNCSYEAAPITSAFELEVGLDLATMLGYDPKKAWGHITSGGTVANFEAIWLARNLKSIPLAVKEIKPELLKSDDDWVLLNMETEEVLDLISLLKEKGILEKVLDVSVRSKGISKNLGKLLVPKTRHYCWNKVLDIFGIGRDNLITVPVQDNYRMNITELNKIIKELADKKIPILGLVSVVGSTEEGSVDRVDEVVKLRNKYKKKGINFYYHIDAAYGGYARTLFVDSENNFIKYDKLSEIFYEESDIKTNYACPSLNVYNAFKAMPNADSITIDCHKLGYIPYPAGAIALKDKRILALLDYSAAYVDSDSDPAVIGPYIMEGSKPGASACAVWCAHKTLPLNVTGYGKLIARTIEASSSFFVGLNTMMPFVAINGKAYIAAPLTKPDTNVIIFVFNELGNTSLKNMNTLNEKIYNECSYVSGSLYNKPFITSKTILSKEEYDNTPKSFLNKLNISESEFDDIKEIFVLRAAIMTPFFADQKNFLDYWGEFIEVMKTVVAS